MEEHISIRKTRLANLVKSILEEESPDGRELIDIMNVIKSAIIAHGKSNRIHYELQGCIDLENELEAL